MRRTAAAANDSSSIDEALAAAIEEVCRFTGSPIGHAFLVSADDPELLVPTGVSISSDQERYAAFRAATDSSRLVSAAAFRARRRRSTAGVRLDRGFIGEPAESSR